jgi:hypothetical protein
VGLALFNTRLRFGRVKASTVPIVTQNISFGIHLLLTEFIEALFGAEAGISLSLLHQFINILTINVESLRLTVRAVRATTVRPFRP